MAKINKRRHEQGYSTRIAALLSELADVLAELVRLLRDSNAKSEAQPRVDDPQYLAGWSVGWDACAAEVMSIVQNSEQNIRTIEGK